MHPAKALLLCAAVCLLAGRAASAQGLIVPGGGDITPCVGGNCGSVPPPPNGLIVPGGSDGAPCVGGSCGAPPLPEGSCGCGKKVVPVCAKSGYVYNNNCLTKCGGQQPRFTCGTRTDCAKDCREAAGLCPTIFAPVCARSGEVFFSECLMKFAKKNLRFACGDRTYQDCDKACKKKASGRKL